MPTRVNQAATAAAGAAGLALLFEALRRLGDLKLYVVETIALGLAAGILYLVALYALERTADRRAAFWLILAGAILFRLILFPLEPSLSDDVHRYRWEGRVQSAGWNPYSMRPDDPRLRSLRADPDAHAEKIPGRDIPSIYPPLAELVLAGAYRALPGTVLYKAPFLAADLLIVFLLAGWLRKTGGRNVQLAVYAWNPLVVVEFAASGHADALATAALLAASFAIIRGRSGVSTLLLAAGALVKVFPIVLLPLWLRRAGWPREARSWINLWAAAALAAACAWPFLSGWRQFLDSLKYYESRWQENNASLYTLVAWATGSRELAAGLGVGVVTGLALWAAFRFAPPDKDGASVFRAVYILIGTMLLLSPNAFSWYFTWIVPFLGLMPLRRGTLAWLLLTVLQFISYHVLVDYQASGTWRVQPFFLWLTYGPFFALLAWHGLKSQMNR